MIIKLGLLLINSICYYSESYNLSNCFFLLYAI